MTQPNKTIVVTGASSGIGFGIARSFLESGWNVVVNARNDARLHDAAGTLGHPERVAPAAGSTADQKTGEALVALAHERFGGVDMLVNNAGEFGQKAFVEVSEQDLDHYYSVNLKGTVLTTQAVVRAFLSQGRGGNVVNIGTVLASHGTSWVHGAAPLVSKGGIHSLTIALAAELAPVGIRVNCVAPGFVRTPLMSGAHGPTLAGSALLGRVGEVEDISAAVQYFAGATFVTGQILNVDGGYVAGRR